MKMTAVMTHFQNVQVSRWQLFTAFACETGSSKMALPRAHVWGPSSLWRGSSHRLLRRNNKKMSFGCIVSTRRDYLYSPHSFGNLYVSHVSVYSGCCNKYHRSCTGWPKCQTFISHSSRELEVSDRGTSRFGIWWKPSSHWVFTRQKEQGNFLVSLL